MPRSLRSFSRFSSLALLVLLPLAQAVQAEIMVEERSLSTPAPKVTASASVTATGPVENSVVEKVIVSPGVASVAQDSGNSSWDSYKQLQQLQQQIELMQGQLEQQGHLIEKLQSDLRTRYTDLDQRLSAQQEQLKTAASSTMATTPAGDAAPASSTIEEENKAYLAAMKSFQPGGPTDKAIPPMLAFVKRYPHSTFTPGAYYWLGEFYLNASTPDQAAAQKHFETVLTKYPDNAKAPASLYKLGSILDLQGRPQDAKKKMQELMARYPKSPESALADSYLKALEAAEAQAAKPAAKAESKPAAKPAAKKPAKKS